MHRISRGLAHECNTLADLNGRRPCGCSFGNCDRIAIRSRVDSGGNISQGWARSVNDCALSRAGSDQKQCRQERSQNEDSVLT